MISERVGTLATSLPRLKAAAEFSNLNMSRNLHETIDETDTLRSALQRCPLMRNKLREDIAVPGAIQSSFQTSTKTIVRGASCGANVRVLFCTVHFRLPKRIRDG